MKFENVSILSVAYEDAPIRVLSSDIESKLANTLSRLGQKSDVIQGLTGIKARRLWDVQFKVSDAATLAARKALKSAGISPEQVGVLINTSVCRDFLEPSVACFVHRNLQLSTHCMNFDITNACLGFTDGMQIVGNMIERGQIDYGLVVDGENSSEILDATLSTMTDSELNLESFHNHFAALTLGSGAVAMVLTRSELASKKHLFRGGVTLANSSQNQLCLGNSRNMVTDAKTLLVAGVDLARKTLIKANQEMGCNLREFDSFVMHQVGGRHIAKLTEYLELDDSKVFKIYQEYGNIGPASVPITLAKAIEAGEIQEGARVALMGIGSGLNCSMLEVLW
jgi:acyl-CoA:acyl-CoA alkyltransferase